MPKKGKKGKEKGKEKGKKKIKKDENAEAIVKSLMKSYEKFCVQSESQMCPGIKQLMKKCIEETKLIVKFIFEPLSEEREGEPPVLLDALLTAIRTERYVYCKDIHIWNYPMSYENIAALSLLAVKPVYPIRQIEMMDCLIEPYSLKRFSSILLSCVNLTTLNLDYNEFGDEGCLYLCNGLVGNVTLLSLSMCYCDLEAKSGEYLGKLISTTAIQELYLDGNNLECEGTVELIKLCVDQAEFEAFRKAEAAKLKEEEEARLAQEGKERDYSKLGTSGDNTDDGVLLGDKKKKKKGKKKKKKKAPPLPPPVGPWLTKLHLADNGIDPMGEGREMAPLNCMRLFKKLLMFSEGIEEIDLDDNLIGDMGGREIVDGLSFRKEEKLKGVKVRTTHRMTSETFDTIVKLASGLKKKKKKGKKKKKKK